VTRPVRGLHDGPTVKTKKTARSPALVHAREAIAMPAGGLTLAVLADTHGRPHPALDQRIAEAAPGHILHAGDIGDLNVLASLRNHAPVTAVRGNIDARMPDLPDAVTIDLRGESGTPLKILLVHIAVNGLKIRADVARLARAEEASIVVCGHSHVPFAAHDGGAHRVQPRIGRTATLPTARGARGHRRDA